MGQSHLESPGAEPSPGGFFVAREGINPSFSVYHFATLSLRFIVGPVGFDHGPMGEGITWQRCNAAQPWFESTVGPPGEDSSVAERWGTTPEALVRLQLLAPFSSARSHRFRITPRFRSN